MISLVSTHALVHCNEFVAKQQKITTETRVKNFPQKNFLPIVSLCFPSLEQGRVQGREVQLLVVRPSEGVGLDVDVFINSHFPNQESILIQSYKVDLSMLK